MLFGGQPERMPRRGIPIEVLDHCCLGDVGDTISYGLKTLEERAEGLVAFVFDRLEVPRLGRLVEE